jgi:hypothetical protein
VHSPGPKGPGLGKKRTKVLILVEVEKIKENRRKSMKIRVCENKHGVN